MNVHNIGQHLKFNAIPMLTIPNIITLIRILLIPVFLTIFYLPYEWAHFAAAFTFWFAAISDALDGYLARTLNQTTAFGAFLDPVADKIMVASALVLISQEYASAWITIPALIMIGREIIISALREWMAERGLRDSVAVSFAGKVKTAFQMLALIGLIWQPGGFLQILSYAFYYIAMVMTVWSMVQYFQASWKNLVDSAN